MPTHLDRAQGALLGLHAGEGAAARTTGLTPTEALALHGLPTPTRGGPTDLAQTALDVTTALISAVYAGHGPDSRAVGTAAARAVHASTARQAPGTPMAGAVPLAVLAPDWWWQTTALDGYLRVLNVTDPREMAAVHAYTHLVRHIVNGAPKTELVAALATQMPRLDGCARHISSLVGLALADPDGTERWIGASQWGPFERSFATSCVAYARPGRLEDAIARVALTGSPDLGVAAAVGAVAGAVRGGTSLPLSWLGGMSRTGLLSSAAHELVLLGAGSLRVR